MLIAKEHMTSVELQDQFHRCNQVLAPQGRHQESLVQAVGQSGIHLDLLHGFARFGDHSKVLDVRRDSAVPQLVSNVPGTLGFGCYHQFVQTQKDHLNEVHSRHLYQVEDARFVIATRIEDFQKFLERLLRGDELTVGSEHDQMAEQIMERDGYEAVTVLPLPPGSTEWSGRYDDRLDAVVSLARTCTTLNGYGLMTKDDLDNLEDVHMDVFWTNPPQ